MEKTKRLILIIGVFLVIPAFACMSPSLTPPKTPTPTSTVIFAKELQTPGVSTEAPVDHEEACLKTAAGAVNVGNPCILGTYDAHYDIKQTPTASQTMQTSSLLHADLSLWAVSVGKLQGSAHLTYFLNSKGEDVEGVCGRTYTDTVNQFGWDVVLNGQYFMQPDGSIQFFVQASPVQGPNYVEVLTAPCPIPPRPQNGVIWNGLGGKFVQGVFHSVKDIPIPSDATGRFYVETLLQVVK